MNRYTRLAACMTLALVTASAMAQQTTQSIEMRSNARPMPRTDIQTLCPDIQNELPDNLAAIALQVAEPALIKVQFALDNRSISDIVVSGGPVAYQRAVRRAVRGLLCRSPEAGRQDVELRVQFIDPYAVAPGQSVVAPVR